jgi:primary-amine oxidase
MGSRVIANGSGRCIVLALAAISLSSCTARALEAPSRHPLDPLTAAEITATVSALKAQPDFPRDARFPILTLREPPKEEVLRYQPGAPMRRRAFAVVYDRARNGTYEAVVDLNDSRVVSWKEIRSVQPLFMSEEYESLPNVVRADPRWQAAIRRRGITDFDGVMIDVWAAGYAGEADSPRTRLARALSFYRGKGQNAFARPIEGVVAVVDMNRKQVLQVVDAGVVPVARSSADLSERAIGTVRRAPRPLQVVQRLGPTYEVRGQEVRWQNWRFRFRMEPREGLVLQTAGYEDGGRVRSILYRGSLSEMVVPYSDPSGTWVFRNAFDVGEYGLGRMANTLVPGQDAPDNATFFDASFADDLGQPQVRGRAVALYERDGGLLWRHYDDEVESMETRRARELVLCFTATLGNYDYCLNWVFHQDGTLEVEALLTGIMLAKGVVETKMGPEAQDMSREYGHLVAPNVLAVSHQHFFSFRLDMDVDAPAPNSVVELNTRAEPPGPMNRPIKAFRMFETPLASEREARRDLNLASGRMWKVQNPAARNALGYPAGYLLVPGENAVPFVAPESLVRRRAGFLDHHLWATRYDPTELYAAGDYINQSPGGEGLPKWIRRNASLRDADVVLWYTMGVSHIPRPEEWPVMTVHRAGFRLMPAGFFDRNPSLDVPVKPDESPRRAGS